MATVADGAGQAAPRPSADALLAALRPWRTGAATVEDAVAAVAAFEPPEPARPEAEDGEHVESAGGTTEPTPFAEALVDVVWALGTAVLSRLIHT